MTGQQKYQSSHLRELPPLSATPCTASFLTFSIITSLLKLTSLLTATQIETISSSTKLRSSPLIQSIAHVFTGLPH
ncbi:hypothetical protein J002_05610 [Cryptococcus neoformans]|nr:hypothetical protein J002_05610 [Cryptococcus neoformans var. grubii]